MKKSKNLKQEALKLIAENRKVVFLSDVYQGLGISSSTFYRKIPTDSEDYIEITEALEGNKTLMKQVLRDRLAEAKNVAGQIFLYKLLTTDPVERALMNDRYEEKSKAEIIELEIK